MDYAIQLCVLFFAGAGWMHLCVSAYSYIKERQESRRWWLERDKMNDHMFTFSRKDTDDR